MVSVEQTVEVDGYEYQVKIQENGSVRDVTVFDEKGYTIVRDVRKSYDTRSWFEKKILRKDSPAPLPDRSEHVADVINEAISKVKNASQKEAEMRQAMQPSLEAAKEVWEGE